MILKITQKIIYEIDGTINFGFNKLLLTPQNNESQKILDWKINIQGGKKELNSKDQFGNQIELVSILNNSKKIEYNIFGKVETKSNFGIKQITNFLLLKHSKYIIMKCLLLLLYLVIYHTQL